MFKIFNKKFFILLILLSGFISANFALAAYERISPGEIITIGEFVYDDDFQATTTPCTLSVYDPTGSLIVNEVSMTALSSGWHYYNVTSTDVKGSWPTTMTCGTLGGGDLAKLDKTFIVGYVNASTTDISNAIWNDSARTLTDYSTSTIASGVWSATGRTLSSFGTLISDIWSNGTRTLSSFGTLVADIWNNSTRTLSSFGTLVADIWNNGTRTLSEALLGNGDKLATNSYIDTATSTIITEVLANRTLINNLNNISATDVWNSASRSLTDYSTSTIASSVWDRATSTLSTLGSVGKHLVDNLDAQVSSRGTSTLTAADIWNAGTRSLTDYSTSSVALAVWNNAARTLTSYGNDITAADVWNVLSGSLTLDNSIGKQLATNIDSTVSSRASQASITALNNISASDVWSYANRSITDPASVWDYATTLIGTNGSVGKLIKDNLDAQVSSRSSHTAADVWNVVGRTLTSNANFNDPSSATIASAVWSQATRDLTSYGNDITAADVWNVLSANLTTNGTVGKQLATNIDATVSSRSTLTAANVWEYANRTLSSFGTLVADIWNNGTRTLSEALWTVSTSDFGTITAGSNYLATVTTIYNGTLTDSLNVPTVTVYDPGRNVIVNSVAMTRTATGTYSYSYTTASNAPAGTWESVFSATVGIGKTLTGNDYWSVAVSPPQVIINSISDNTIPTISANVTITNEGLTGYEYQYEWCVVSSVNNACGGGDDVFHATAAKFINPGEDWNTNLTANVSTIGNYYFKVIVYFGTDNSGASRSFTAQAEVITPPAGGGGGGSGGGNNSVVPTPSTTPINSVCNDADFNNDKKVNSVDFSILLAFWKTSWPFRNKCVDINSDKQVNSVDFSILMYQWGSKK